MFVSCMCIITYTILESNSKKLIISLYKQTKLSTHRLLMSHSKLFKFSVKILHVNFVTTKFEKVISSNLQQQE